MGFRVQEKSGSAAIVFQQITMAEMKSEADLTAKTKEILQVVHKANAYFISFNLVVPVSEVNFFYNIYKT